MQALALVLIGCALAFVSGGLGIGGGILAVPVLFYFGRFSGLPAVHVAHIAVAVSLAVACIINASAAISYVRQGRVRFLEGALLVSGSMVGAFAAGRFALHISATGMAVLFGSALLANGLVSLRKKAGGPPLDDGDSHVTPRALLTLLPLAGLVIGAVAGTTGIGGGVLMVPMFARLFRFPVKSAIATSSACITLTALAGTVSFLTLAAPGLPEPHIGFVYLPYVIPLSLGALIGGYTGATVSGRTRPIILIRLFAFVQIAAGTKLLWDSYVSFA